MKTQSDHERANAAIRLADLFSDCVECFGIIHPGKKSCDRNQRLLLTQLGVEQARLLAWGDNVGICRIAYDRNHLLDDEQSGSRVETALKNMISRPLEVDRAAHFQRYGLKPSKKIWEPPEPALDYTRMESFRERYRAMAMRRSASVVANHWVIADAIKFKAYLNLIQDNVNTLIDLADNSRWVHNAVMLDIRALGWHPAFDRTTVSSDAIKLNYIQQACTETYPEYCEATKNALKYLHEMWRENYQCLLQDAKQAEKASQPKPLVQEANSEEQTKKETTETKPKRKGLLSQLSSRFRKAEKQACPDTKRSRSWFADNSSIQRLEELTQNRHHRAHSVGTVTYRPKDSVGSSATDVEGDQKTGPRLRSGSEGMAVELIQSKASRHGHHLVGLQKV